MGGGGGSWSYVLVRKMREPVSCLAKIVKEIARDILTLRSDEKLGRDLSTRSGGLAFRDFPRTSFSRACVSVSDASLVAGGISGNDLSVSVKVDASTLSTATT